MGRTDEAVAAPEEAAAAAVVAAGAQETMKKEGEGPAEASRAREKDARLARRRARVDAAAACVFRTKLLRQFAALMYKNRESNKSQRRRRRRRIKRERPRAARAAAERVAPLLSHLSPLP
jgi:hypothetical protein